MIDISPKASRKKNRKQKAADFVIQGSILAMTGIVVRVIGVFYRMLLSDIIERQGGGYYTSAFNVYNIPLILSSYSMSMAVSKVIPARLARGEHKNCSRILKTAPTHAVAVGGVTAVVPWFGAGLFAELIKTPLSRYALETLTPIIWVMAYPDVFRGYFQGTGTMVPTTVSQTLEQTINAVVSVVATGVLFGVGTSINVAQGVRDYSYALGVAGGTTGTGAGTLAVFLFFMCPTTSKGRERRQLVREDVSRRAGSYHRIFYILTIAVPPIVISNDIYNCSNVMGSHLFDQSMDKLGYLKDSIATYWGVLGQYQLLSSILVVVSNTLSSSLIPSLARAVVNRSRREKLERITTSIRSPLLIAIPVVVGITVLARPVYNLLFISEDNIMLIQLSIADPLAVAFCSLSAVTNITLRGLNHMDVPIRHAVIALAIRVAALGVLLMIFRMEIYSVVFANIIFALVMCLLNRRTIARFVRHRQEYKRTLILPTICTGFMGAAVHGVYKGIYALLPYRLMRGRIGMAIVVPPSMMVTILVYIVLLVRFRAVEEGEPKGISGERRLVRLLNRFRLLG